MHANDGYVTHQPLQRMVTFHTQHSVPTMIPASLGYCHHSVEYWQYTSPPSESTTVQCDAYTGSAGEDPKCSISVPSRGVTIAHTNVSAHSSLEINSSCIHRAFSPASILGSSCQHRSACSVSVRALRLWYRNNKLFPEKQDMRKCAQPCFTRESW